MLMDEKDGWEEIIVESQVVEFKNPGDYIHGVYTEKKPNSGRWNKNRYTLEVNNEDRYVYGTTDLDEKFKQINAGDEVHIELKKCIKSEPPKKPFKVFQVFRRSNSEKNDSNMMEYEDSEAEESIRLIKQEIGEKSDDSAIIDYAKNVEGYSEEDISRIKICLANHRKLGAKK